MRCPEDWFDLCRLQAAGGAMLAFMYVCFIYLFIILCMYACFFSHWKSSKSLWPENRPFHPVPYTSASLLTFSADGNELHPAICGSLYQRNCSSNTSPTVLKMHSVESRGREPRPCTEQFQLQILHPTVPINLWNISEIPIFEIQVVNYWKRSLSIVMIKFKVPSARQRIPLQFIINPVHTSPYSLFRTAVFVLCIWA